MKQTIEVTIDAQEITGLAAAEWKTLRKEITPDGALGVANNTGFLSLSLNGHVTVSLFLHEVDGKVVVTVLNGKGQAIGRTYPEDDGFVPPRNQKVRTK